MTGIDSSAELHYRAYYRLYSNYIGLVFVCNLISFFLLPLLQAVKSTSFTNSYNLMI